MSRQSSRPLLCIISFATAILVGGSLARADDPPKLLGRCVADQLAQEPYGAWFGPGYSGYVPNPEVLESLRGLDTAGLDITVFFGTWCRDSQREVPRLLKLTDALALSPEAVRLIAVDSAAGMHKRSPQGEEEGLEIYRVPTIVIRRDGEELSRIVEYPALSLERDLLAILTDADYQPSYASYPEVRHWLDAGLLADPNVRADGLADRIRSSISSQWELAAPARVLRDRGDLDEAVKLYEINRALYPRSARHHAQLAEALVEAGDWQGARAIARSALELNADPEDSVSLVDLLEQALEGAAGRSPTRTP